MPALTVFANRPRGKRRVRRRNPGAAWVLSRRVRMIEYDHTADGKVYRHTFRTGVMMDLLPDGSVRLYHEAGKPLWKDE
jgi:hypothetical protein